MYAAVPRRMNERRKAVNGMVSSCSVKMPSHPLLTHFSFFLSTDGIANVSRRNDGGLWRRQPTFRDHIMCDLSIQCSKDCQHVFHSECIMDWLVKYQECPCCRTAFGDTEHDVKERDSAPDLSTAAPTTTLPAIPM
jgi:hypothetical protein